MASVEKKKIFHPEDYEEEFDPEAYLQFYYSSKALDDGTRLSLFSLPMFAHIIRQKLPEDKRVSLIDVGAGPTVYSAISFRNIVKRVYLTDFVDKSLTMLEDWLYARTPFSWEKAIKVIARTEGSHLKNEKEINDIEEEARKVVENGGIYKADVHTDAVLVLDPKDPEPKDKQFDIVVSVFCLESACSTHEEYISSLKNMVSLLRPGGYLVLGSVIDDVIYNSGLSQVGNSKLFSLLNLSEEFIEECFAEEHMDMASLHKYPRGDYININKGYFRYSLPQDGVAFFLVAKGHSKK